MSLESQRRCNLYFRPVSFLIHDWSDQCCSQERYNTLSCSGTRCTSQEKEKPDRMKTCGTKTLTILYWMLIYTVDYSVIKASDTTYRLRWIGIRLGMWGKRDSWVSSEVSRDRCDRRLIWTYRAWNIGMILWYYFAATPLTGFIFNY